MAVFNKPPDRKVKKTTPYQLPKWKKKLSLHPYKQSGRVPTKPNIYVSKN